MLQSGAQAGFENGSRSFRFYHRYREWKKANETGTRASFERDGLNHRERSELIKLYSKRILDLGVHKVPSPLSLDFPALRVLGEVQRKNVSESERKQQINRLTRSCNEFQERRRHLFWTPYGDYARLTISPILLSLPFAAFFASE